MKFYLSVGLIFLANMFSNLRASPLDEKNSTKLKRPDLKKIENSTNTSQKERNKTISATPQKERNKTISEVPQKLDRQIENYQMSFSNDNPEFLYSYANKIKCTMAACQPPNFCIDNSTCKCGEGFANFFPTPLPDGGAFFNVQNFNQTQRESNINAPYCSYRQKNQFMAFLLEFLFPFGVGHFYAGRVTFGGYKLLCAFGPLAILCCTICLNLVNQSHDADFRKEYVLFCFLYGMLRIYCQCMGNC